MKKKENPVNLPKGLTLERAINKQMRHILIPYFKNIPKFPAQIIDLCVALVRTGCKDSSSKVKKFHVWIVDNIRERISEATVEDISRLAQENYSKRFAADGECFAITNFIFGTKLGQFELAKKMVKLLNDCVHNNPNIHKDVDDLYQDKGYITTMVMEFIFVCNYTKTMENLVARILIDEEAKKIFENFVGIYLVTRGLPKLIKYSKWNNIPNDYKKHRMIFFHQEEIDGIEFEGVLPIPDAYYENVLKVVSDLAERTGRDNKKKTKFINWFQSHIEYFHSECQRMWQEINDHPKCWLRPGGMDRVDIDLKSFSTEDLCILSLQFFREKCEFPAVWVRFWAKMNGRIITIDYKIIDCDIKNYSVKSLSADDPRIVVDKIYMFIATHCLHRLVCQPEYDDISPEKDEEKKPRKIIIRKTKTEVRPHFRNLPEGQTVSDEAKRLSRELWILEPPEGMTFVKSYIRNLEEEYKRVEKIKPLFIYKDKDIGL